jgi:myo-inositol-1(or 4)-monophosphatase
MLEILKEACRRAYVQTGKLLGSPEGSIKFNVGAGGDISRKIDLVGERAVIETIKRCQMNPTIVGEECGLIDGTDGFLIMDAVDGTTNAFRGIPYCCCSLAFATEPKLSYVTEAAVIDLTNGDLYSASKGDGSYLNDRKIDTKKGETPDLDDLVGGVNISAMPIEMLLSLAPFLMKIKHLRHFGANALELCHLARGLLDLSVDFRMKIRPTDVAASFLIVTEAGGKILDPSGGPIDSSVFPKTTLSYIGLSDIAIFRYIEPYVKGFFKKRSARAGIRTRVGGVTVPHTGPDYTAKDH